MQQRRHRGPVLFLVLMVIPLHNSAYAADHRLQSALLVLDEMKNAGVRPDVVTYNTILAVCDEVCVGQGACGYIAADHLVVLCSVRARARVCF